MKIQVSSPALITPTSTSSEPSAVVPILKGGHIYRDNLLVLLPAGAEDTLVGREDVGRAVWEFFEAEAKKWEEEEKEQKEKEKEELKSEEGGEEQSL